MCRASWLQHLSFVSLFLRWRSHLTFPKKKGEIIIRAYASASALRKKKGVARARNVLPPSRCWLKRAERSWARLFQTSPTAGAGLKIQFRLIFQAINLHSKRRTVETGCYAQRIDIAQRTSWEYDVISKADCILLKGHNSLELVRIPSISTVYFRDNKSCYYRFTSPFTCIRERKRDKPGRPWPFLA